MNTKHMPVLSRDPVCPICGQPNDCALARAGDPGALCWCADVAFSADAITRIPEQLRGQSCMCRRCASHIDN